ncbi:MAG: response regulator transcription factor [Candidatus Binatia bacterium]
MPIRVFHADDHQVFRDGVRLLLERESDIKIVGSAGDAKEAVKEIQRLKPDVAVVDLGMPGGGMLSMIRRLREEAPNVKVLVLTMFDNPSYIYETIAAGALGYLLKEASGEEVVRAVRTVAAGQGYLASAVTLPVLRKLAEDARLEGRRHLLSEREIEILELISAGAANKEIADRLKITEVTVKAHLRNLYAKIGAQNRAHAVTIALQQKIIE